MISVHGSPSMQGRITPSPKLGTDDDTQLGALGPHLGSINQPPLPNNLQEDNNNNSPTCVDQQLTADGEYLDTDITLQLRDDNREVGQPGPSFLNSLQDQRGPTLRTRRNPPLHQESSTQGAPGRTKGPKRHTLK